MSVNSIFIPALFKREKLVLFKREIFIESQADCLVMKRVRQQLQLLCWDGECTEAGISIQDSTVGLFKQQEPCGEEPQTGHLSESHLKKAQRILTELSQQECSLWKSFGLEKGCHGVLFAVYEMRWWLSSRGGVIECLLLRKNKSSD